MDMEIKKIETAGQVTVKFLRVENEGLVFDIRGQVPGEMSFSGFVKPTRWEAFKEAIAAADKLIASCRWQRQ